MNKLGSERIDCIKVKTERGRYKVERKRESEWAIYYGKKRKIGKQKQKGTGQWKKDREEKKGNLNTVEQSI